MGAYEYQALDLRGRTRKGVASGDTARQVRQQLREQGLMPLTVVGVEEREGSRRGSRRRIGTTDLAVITRQLATLLGSNLTIEEALDALIEQSESHHLKSTLTGIRSTVMGGGTFSGSGSVRLGLFWPRFLPQSGFLPPTDSDKSHGGVDATG